ncbi:MAG: hypothetical protein R3B09_35830 [Nannocystaceae bacterium]
MVAERAREPTSTLRGRRSAYARALASILVALALVAPSTARARALPEETRAQVEALYSEANTAAELGEYARAADRYREVLRILPEGEDTYETRAVALADAIRAYRRADEEGGDPRSLCRASALASEYLREARSAFGIDAAVMDGPKSAIRERDAIHSILAGRDLSCETVMKSPAPAPEPAVEPEPEPEPAAPRRQRARVTPEGSPPIGGATSPAPARCSSP